VSGLRDARGYEYGFHRAGPYGHDVPADGIACDLTDVQTRYLSQRSNGLCENVEAAGPRGDWLVCPTNT
jgi:hypothetical protein